MVVTSFVSGDQLVRWLKFESSANTAGNYKAEVGDNSGLYLQTPFTNASGKFGEAVDFSTTSPSCFVVYMDDSMTDWASPKDITFSFWYKPTFDLSTGNAKLFSLDMQGPHGGIEIALTHQSPDDWYIMVNNDEVEFNGKSTLTQNVWSHISLVIDTGNWGTGDMFELYQDGVKLIKSIDSANIQTNKTLLESIYYWDFISGNQDVSCPCSTGPSYMFNGLMDNLKIYDYAKTDFSKEVTDEFENGVSTNYQYDQFALLGDSPYDLPVGSNFIDEGAIIVDVVNEQIITNYSIDLSQVTNPDVFGVLTNTYTNTWGSQSWHQATPMERIIHKDYEPIPIKTAIMVDGADVSTNKIYRVGDTVTGRLLFDEEITLDDNGILLTFNNGKSCYLAAVSDLEEKKEANFTFVVEEGDVITNLILTNITITENADFQAKYGFHPHTNDYSLTDLPTNFENIDFGNAEIDLIYQTATIEDIDFCHHSRYRGGLWTGTTPRFGNHLQTPGEGANECLYFIASRPHSCDQ